MYTEGQTLKITATSTSSFRKIFGDKQITVVVTMINGNLIRVQSSEFEQIRGRDEISIVVEAIGPTFYPDWTIEVVDAPVVAIETPVAEKSAEPMSREDWNNYKAVYQVNASEDSYEEYLAAQTKIEDKAVSDNYGLSLAQVLDEVAKQETVHPRDVSFIMDGLSCRECQAFVTHHCFPLDSASDNRGIGWALKLGLIDAKSGKFTEKGKSFMAVIS